MHLYNQVLKTLVCPKTVTCVLPVFKTNLLTTLFRHINLYPAYTVLTLLQALIVVCTTGLELRFYGCCGPCFYNKIKDLAS